MFQHNSIKNGITVAFNHPKIELNIAKKGQLWQ